jgi:hypothetical protein
VQLVTERLGSEKNVEINSYERPFIVKLKVIVSFFSQPAVVSQTRRCVFSATSPHHLRQKITENMLSHEEFACYRDVTGIVVALDKQGVCVTV